MHWRGKYTWERENTRERKVYMGENKYMTGSIHGREKTHESIHGRENIHMRGKYTWERENTREESIHGREKKNERKVYMGRKYT